MMRWYNDGGWFIGMTLMVLLVAAVVAIAVAVVVRPGERTRPSEPVEPWRAAERELEMRFARGDIDSDTLARGRAALRDRSG